MRVFYLFIVFVSFTSLAQETLVNDNNPPSLKWYQLNTKHFRVLYPTGFDAQAQRMANTLEHIHEPESRTMGGRAKKISVILQNQSSVSNGFVSITPRRSEFYGMPSQNYNFLGNNDWLDLLATHEYRHIVQYQHATRGVNKGIYYLFGANGLSLMSYVTVPQWFWEGDAVATETAFTHSGRGRIPNFDLILRTNLLENRNFSYDKQYLRSYKHNIPDHYKLGFHMVSYLRKKTNNAEVWENITRRAWSLPLPSAFSHSIKKETGLSVKQLYNEMSIDLKKQWQAQLDTTTLTPFEKVNNRSNNVYTDYRFPQELEDGSVLVQKSGIGDIETLVTFKNGKTKNVYTQGIMNETGMLSATNSRVVWNEYRFDPRWRVKTFSAIVGYDLGSQTKTVIASKGRYAGAALSPDGYLVATVETTTDYQTNLIILDYFNGKEIKRFENPNNDFISMPRFSEDGKNVVALKTNRKGKAIIQFSLETGEEKNLTDFSNENIGHPVPTGNYVLYNSPISGIDNIYALAVSTGDRFQITSSKYGAYNPNMSRDGKTIFYNDQGKDGLDVAKITFDPSAWKKWTAKPQPASFFQHLVDQEGVPDLLSTIPTEKFSVKKYSRLRGLVNPYTWGTYFDNDLTNVYLGITSKDLLGTTTINAGYLYDIAEKTESLQATVSYQGLFPIIDVKASMADRISNRGSINYGKIVGNDTLSTTENLSFTWKEKTLEVGLRVPLNLTTSRFVSNLTFSNYVGNTYISQFKNNLDGGGRLFPSNLPQYFFRDIADNGNLIYNHFSLSGYRLLKQSRRDILSKWGQAFFMNLYGTPYGGEYKGAQFSFYGIGYFPGLFRHHSIWGHWGYQSSEIPQAVVSSRKGLDNYTFRNRIPLPRGLTVSRFQQFYSMAANYTLPVWYPDLAIGPLLNVQRVRLNGFIDYGFGSSTFGSRTITQTYTSIGAEVKFDINLVRLLPQFDIGFRYSYGLTPSTTLFEVLVGNFNF